MLKLEIKRNVFSIYTFLAIFGLLLLFLMGNLSGAIEGKENTSFLFYMWSKFNNNPAVRSEFSTYYYINLKKFVGNNDYASILTPVIVGLPTAMVYLEDINSGYRRMIISRTSKNKYFLVSLLITIITAVIVAVTAIIFFDLLIVIFFDKNVNDQFLVDYFASLGKPITGFSPLQVMKNMMIYSLPYLLYIVKAALVFKMAAIFLRDKYVTITAIFLVYYVQMRIYTELVEVALFKPESVAAKISNIIDPNFLYSVGEYGFYKNKAWLAYLIMIILIAGSVYFIAKKYFKQEDFSSESGV